MGKKRPPGEVQHTYAPRLEARLCLIGQIHLEANNDRKSPHARALSLVVLAMDSALREAMPDWELMA